METGYQRVLDALESTGLVSGGWGGRVTARCPAHDDTRASLSLGEGDEGKALLFCFAGCALKEVVDALGLSMSDLFSDADNTVVAEYVYRSENGSPLYRVLRTADKDFSQERYVDAEPPVAGDYRPGLKDVRRVLYNLPEVLAAAEAGGVVYLVEGEKDADNLSALGHTATSLSGGSNARWDNSYATALAGANIKIIADNDEPGFLHAQKIQDGLIRSHLLASSEILVAAHGKDVTDHLNAGYTLDQLVSSSAEELEVFEPFDWQSYVVPKHSWLYEPYVPRAARVLAFGAAGSLKSLWAMWLAAKLSQEGKKVAYFSIEMSRAITAKRLQRLEPGPGLKVFSSFMLGQNLETAIKNFEGWDLMVIDSWSAARGDTSENDNDAIATLDRKFFMPLIQATGATLLLLDNTAKPALTESGKVKADSARGATAKGDKMEVTLWFDRPAPENNFRTRITCKKMRLDTAMPPAVEIETPEGEIEFYHVGSSGMDLTRPVWSSTEPSAPSVSTPPASSSTKEESVPGATEMTPLERRQFARAEAMMRQLRSNA